MRDDEGRSCLSMELDTIDNRQTGSMSSGTLSIEIIVAIGMYSVIVITTIIYTFHMTLEAFVDFNSPSKLH